MRAAVHPRQTERLQSLYEYDILDTERERGFDEIAELVAGLCEAPIAVVNFIDAERQWFKAEVGLGVRETPLETSICSHVILQHDFIEIHDTLTDSRMQDNPLCCGDPGLRFYAGALLKGRDGLPIGTLCVLDHQPRTLTPLQRDAIRILANQVMNQLDLRAALRRKDVLSQEIDHRVKNSLQSVSAMIRLQSSRADNDDTRLALEVVERRISTVAALHEELYRVEAGAQINLKLFMANVERLLKASCPERVSLTFAVDDILVNSRQASSVGIIVCEFVANSYKHAFSGSEEGVIRVTGSHLPTGEAELCCEDDGVGMSNVVDLQQASGLGLRMIDAAATQLGGVLERPASDRGSTLVLTFHPAP